MEEDKKNNGSFEDLSLKENLLRGIFSYGFEVPSAIQSKSIPVLKSGKDIIAQAQSGTGKTNKWILEYETKNPSTNPLMGWESSSDTFTELKLEFSSKDLAINYAKKMKVDFEIIEPKKRKTLKKSYADNFLR